MRRTVLIAACLLTTACGSDSTDTAASGQVTPSATASVPPPPAPSSSSSAEAPASTPTPAPSSTVDPIVADQALVRSLYYGHSQAFGSDLAAGAAYQAAHNHPDFAYTAEQCADFLASTGLTDAYTVSTVPDVAAMALDPGWALPASRYAGMVPSGRVYILPLEYSESDTGFEDNHTDQVHVSVLDGAAYYFQPCE